MEANLLFNLKKYMDQKLYEYTVTRLSSFYKRCYGEFDRRAAHTDREGQPKLIRNDKYRRNEKTSPIRRTFFVKRVYIKISGRQKLVFKNQLFNIIKNKIR